MKKILFLPFLMLLLTGILFLNGCGDSGSSSDGGGGSVDVTVIQAEVVTIDEIKSIPLTGGGSVPNTEAETVLLKDKISEAEDSINDAIESAINGAVKKVVVSGKASFNKNLTNFKNSTVSRLSKSASSTYAVPQKSDSDPIIYSWDETGNITLGAPFFTGGTVDYTFVGSDSWSENYESVSSSKIKFINKYSCEASDKLTFNDVVPVDINITLNGYINSNYKDDFTLMTLKNTSTGMTIEEISEKGGLAVSYRSGFAVSGDTYKCYVVISMDLKAVVDVHLNEAQLTGKMEEEIYDLLDSFYTLEGGATVKVYDEDGELVYTQTLTAEEIW